MTGGVRGAWLLLASALSIVPLGAGCARQEPGPGGPSATSVRPLVVPAGFQTATLRVEGIT
jgi:hypothetical protein